MDLLCQHRVFVLRKSESLDSKSLATMTQDLVGTGNKDMICHPSVRVITIFVFLYKSASKLLSGPGRSLELLAEVVLSGG